VKLAERIQDSFEFIIWRSLRNAPPLTEILTNAVKFLSKGQETNLPENIGDRLSRLIDYFLSSRCLLLLAVKLWKRFISIDNSPKKLLTNLLILRDIESLKINVGQTMYQGR
jgi:uncharacterized membrane protein YqhA